MKRSVLKQRKEKERKKVTATNSKQRCHLQNLRDNICTACFFKTILESCFLQSVLFEKCCWANACHLATRLVVRCVKSLKQNMLRCSNLERVESAVFLNIYLYILAALVCIGFQKQA